jgi:hypothetical protein
VPESRRQLVFGLRSSVLRHAMAPPTTATPAKAGAQLLTED